MSDKENNIITVNVRIERYVEVHEDDRPEVKFNVILEDSEGSKIVCGYSWLKDYLCKVEAEIKHYTEQNKIFYLDCTKNN